MLTKEEIINKLRPFMEGRPEVSFSYLYGSFAKGTQNKLSDVDVAVYLDEKAVPKERRFEIRLELIGDVMSVLKTNEAEVVVLNDAPPLLAHQVQKFGILLESKDERKRLNFSVKSFNRYMDYKSLMAPQLRKFTERINTGTFGKIK